MAGLFFFFFMHPGSALSFALTGTPSPCYDSFQIEVA